MPLGDSNAGAPNPALLQFLFSRQDARRKEARQQQLDQAAGQAAAMKAAREDRKEQRDIALFNQTFQDNQIKAHLNLADRGVAASQAAESSIAAIPGQNFTRDMIDPNLQGESLVGIDGTTIRTPGFAEVIAGLGQSAAKQAYAADPNQVQSAQEEAFRSFYRQIERRPSVGREEMLQDILSQQGAARIGRELELRTAEETSAAQKRGVLFGEREAANIFAKDARRIRKEIGRLPPNSPELPSLRDELNIANAARVNITAKREAQTRPVGLPADAKFKAVARFGNATLAAKFTDRVLEGTESGVHRLGSVAGVQAVMTNISEIAGDFVRVLRSDGGGGTEMLSGFQNAIERGDAKFFVRDEEGRVLELDTISVSLAYFWVKANRGATARFSIKEYTEARKHLGLKSLGSSELQVLSALHTLNEVIGNEFRTVSALANVFGEPDSFMQGLVSEFGETGHEGRRDRINALRGNRRVGRRGAGETDPDTAPSLRLYKEANQKRKKPSDITGVPK
jgi:hypothetical protein